MINTKQILLFLCLFLFVNLHSFSETTPFQSIGDDFCTAITISSNQDYIIITGFTKGALPGNRRVSGFGKVDAYVAKLSLSNKDKDEADEVVWIKQFGSNENDYPQSVTINPNDNSIIVIGKSNGSFPSNNHIGEYDVFATKLDSKGDLIWTRQFGSKLNDYPKSVKIDKNDDSILVVGETEGVFPTKLGYGLVDSFVVKLSPKGEVLWMNQNGKRYKHKTFASEVEVDEEDSSIYLVGSSLIEDEKEMKVEVLKLSREGKVLWDKKYEINGKDEGIFIVSDKKNNSLIVAGQEGLRSLVTKGISYENKGFLLRITRDGFIKDSKKLEVKRIFSIRIDETDSSILVIGEESHKEMIVIRLSNDMTEIERKSFFFNGERKVGLIEVDFDRRRVILAGNYKENDKEKVFISKVGL